MQGEHVAIALESLDRIARCLRERPAEAASAVESLRGKNRDVPDPAFVQPASRRAAVVDGLARPLGLSSVELLILDRLIEAAERDKTSER
jgi:hypothetical protein